MGPAPLAIRRSIQSRNLIGQEIDQASRMLPIG
jgi:hypothetical protein